MSDALERLRDFYFYAPSFLKIKTKVSGVQPLVLRQYQKRFIDFLHNIKGPKRVIVLKPRQAGFSTICAGYFFQKMNLFESYGGLAMADKKGRTQTIAGIYRLYLQELDQLLRPSVMANNTEQIYFDTQKGDGLKSGVLFETANDPNAGRSGTRSFAHLSEAAFYRYANEIDEGVQNSVPLDESTCIIKESTANGKGGIGKPFYELWNAAKSGESIYQSFFVPWYEVDDYQISPINFKPTKEEKDILKMCPSVNDANLVWRRLKLKEYREDSDNSLLTPEERFRQDFPLTDNEAFLSTGSPVFDPYVIDWYINKINNTGVRNLVGKLNISSIIINQFIDRLKVYQPPRQGKQYFIGADVAEGLSIGDSSSVCIIDENYTQVASWHGKIDPDMFGDLLISLGIMYNTALIVPEVNNMGHTTLNTIKSQAYSKIFRHTILDKTTKQKVDKLGWRTTKQSKETMLQDAVSLVREKDANILDKNLLIEMNLVTRGENGIVELNGMDRTVAFCLAIQGRKSARIIEAKTRSPFSASLYDNKQFKKKKKDIFE